MKRKFTAVNRVSVLVMTLVSLALFWKCALNVYAEVEIPTSGETEEAAEEAAGEEMEEEPGKRVRKTVPLAADTVTQVPKYIVEQNVTYMLDESSIVVEETERGSAEGADVVTVSRKVEDLPDNDLARIEKRILHEGISCDLLSVVYQVEEDDENGIPVRYSAVCEYGGLKKYSTSYPSAWQMTAWYDVCEVGTDTVSGNERAEYGFSRIPEKQKTSVPETVESGGERENIEEEEIPSSKPAVRKIEIGQPPEEEGKKVLDIPIPSAAAAAGVGITLPFIIWFGVTTAPLFAQKSAGGYRCIGRIRLKKQEGIYTAYLTRRLAGRAQIPVFQIRLPGRIWKRTKACMLHIQCPDGKKITLTAGKTVGFTVEGE